MFGVVEASAWMHVRNGAFKMGLLFVIRKRFGVSLFWFFDGIGSLLTREK